MSVRLGLLVALFCVPCLASAQPELGEKSMHALPEVEKPQLERLGAEVLGPVERPEGEAEQLEDEKLEHLMRAIALMEERVGIQWCWTEEGKPFSILSSERCL